MVAKSFGPDACVSPTESIVHWGVQEGRRIAIGGIEPLKLLAVTAAAAPPCCMSCLARDIGLFGEQPGRRLQYRLTISC